MQECRLVKNEEKNMDDMTSAERALRYGELKLLRDMKKTHKEEDSRKRKVLKKDMWEIEDNLDVEDDSVDIRDIDFRLRHNQRQVKVKIILDHIVKLVKVYNIFFQQLLKGSTAISYKDLTMLKIILSSGLYPHIAIADEFNSCKVKMNNLCFSEILINFNYLVLFYFICRLVFLNDTLYLFIIFNIIRIHIYILFFYRLLRNIYFILKVDRLYRFIL